VKALKIFFLCIALALAAIGIPIPVRFAHLGRRDVQVVLDADPPKPRVKA
jgi:hypothetical protein